jgi:ATP-dependent DNA helicase RecG
MVGVADDKSIVGFNCSNEKIKQISDTIVNKLKIHPIITSYAINEKKTLMIEVSKSPNPISFEGKYYSRVGNTTREMQAEELRSYFLRTIHWDNIPGDFSHDEIDEQTVKNFVKLALDSGRMPHSAASESVTDILEHLNLLHDGKITNGAVILFGKNPQKYFTNAIVRIGRFKEEDIIIGDKLTSGNLFRQLEEAEEAIKGFINVRYEISDESFKRKEIWDYPIKAIREALLNSLVHRDYFMFNRQTQIKIFDDYIWFHNPGGLPEGCTLDDIMRLHSSIPRNPLVANVMYKSDFIEAWGTGIERMCSAFSEAGLLPPEFKEEMGGFSVYFRGGSFLERLINSRIINDRQKNALRYVIKHGEISNKKYQELNSVSNKTALRDLNTLISIRALRRVGIGKSIVYKK